jgi:hypothetical protein
VKIIAVGPSTTPPFIPDYIILEDGSIRERNGLSKRDDYLIETEVNEPGEGEWVGVASSNRIEVFKSENEGPWRAVVAREAINSAVEGVKDDPVGSVGVIRSAAALMGIDVPLFLNSLNSRRNPGESLEQAFERIKNGKG